MSSNQQQIVEQISQHRLVPVIALEDAALAEPMAAALVAGGLPVAEVTFRTAAAAEAIRLMSARGGFAGGSRHSADSRAGRSGARGGGDFAVSPGFNPRVVRHCLDIGLPIVPGISSPTDVEMALEHGLDVVKFFPAEAMGGLKLLKAISAPYGNVRFMPTGGISPSNVKEYLAFPKVIACGGSWMVKPNLYADGNFSEVERLVREAVEFVAN